MLQEDKCTFVQHALFHLKQTTTLGSRYYYFRFTDEQPEAPRYLVTCPKPHSKQHVAEGGFEKVSSCTRSSSAHTAVSGR